MKLKRILPLLCGLWLMAVSTSFAMENMEFVDASGPTGYYVDTNSITYAKRAELQPDGKKKDYELVQVFYVMFREWGREGLEAMD